MNNDQSHLDQLSLFHYIFGGLGCFFACVPLIYVAIGIVALNQPQPFIDMEGAEEMPVEFINGFGWIFIIIGLFFFITGQITSICIIASGKFIKQRKNHTFSFVFACLMCLSVPFGTVLGIFTIIVLSRDTVKLIYQQQQEGAAF